jgi:hypothetical protein
MEWLFAFVPLSRSYPVIDVKIHLVVFQEPKNAEMWLIPEIQSFLMSVIVILDMKVFIVNLISMTVHLIHVNTIPHVSISWMDIVASVYRVFLVHIVKSTLMNVPVNLVSLLNLILDVSMVSIIIHVNVNPDGNIHRIVYMTSKNVHPIPV